MESIKSILVRRDNLTEEEAEDLVEQAREKLQQRLSAGEMPFDVCEEYFGLEPDYLEQLM